MNTALWVIWFALLVAVGFTAFQFGGFFPAGVVTRRIRQEGWDAGFDRGFPHGLRATGRGDPDDLADDEQWDDTVEDLMQRGRSYYEPLARGAGANLPPVTTAPCPGETDGDMTLKGDSPGPGLLPSLIFDELAASWPERTASSSTLHETSAPLGSPPGGAEPEPPAPVPSDLDQCSYRDLKEPEAAAGSSEAATGAGADPWQDITAQNHDVWEVFSDTEVFGMIQWEIQALKRKLREPLKLTPWKGATA